MTIEHMTLEVTPFHVPLVLIAFYAVHRAMLKIDPVVWFYWCWVQYEYHLWRGHFAHGSAMHLQGLRTFERVWISSFIERRRNLRLVREGKLKLASHESTGAVVGPWEYPHITPLDEAAHFECGDKS